MFKVKWSKFVDFLCKKPKILLLAVPFLLMLTVYIISERELELESFWSVRAYNSQEDIVDGYLVWNEKCHMLSKNPNDRSIRNYVVKQKFEACASGPLVSYVSRDPLNGSATIVVSVEAKKGQRDATCCWTPISRAIVTKPPKGDWDTKISVGKCEDFTERVNLPADVEIAMVSCQRGKATTYKNIHAIINPWKVQSRLDDWKRTNETESTSEDSTKNNNRKLSVLMLGIDSVSRLNFKRNMPKTERHLRLNDWINLQGYNKMGENTFPNLMAILTGMNSSEAYARCKPTEAYGLDNCPMIWYNFRNASYVTAYGEELVSLSTFNYRKVGFVEPPTDYYLRPYILATEKLLKSKKRFGNKYCTGPELSVERVFNYAREFAQTFAGQPYFGFFWTNSISHDDVNGVSSMDDRLERLFARIDEEGIANDTMLVFLSDHGMRWGGIRQTFVGWYEERLPFIYIKLPEWFHHADPEAYQALRVNEHRLTSPYDLYETLRDVLSKAGGQANSSAGCPTCQTLFRPVPQIRGCSDAGIPSHWCTCTAFDTASTTDKIALEGTRRFLEHIENIIKHYRDKKGRRLCAKLKLKKIHRVDKVIDLRTATSPSNATVQGYFYLIEVTPGGARYEATIRYHGYDNFTINEDEISRTNSYATTSTCLEHGSKRYCHCIKK